MEYPTAANHIAGDYGNEAQSCSISVKVANSIDVLACKINKATLIQHNASTYNS